MKRTKATHNGTCQICGLLHAAKQTSNGHVMAKHGYNVKWSQFIGTCTGSDEAPFEESKNLIDAAIAHAERSAAELLIEAERRETTPPADDVPYHQYYRGDAYGRGGYRWERINMITLSMTNAPKPVVVEKTDSGRTRISVPHKDAWLATTHHVGMVSEFVAQLNAGYAQYLRRDAKQLSEYAAWQKARIATWSPSELKPRQAPR